MVESGITESNADGTIPTAGVDAARTFTYDANGNVTSIAAYEARTGKTWTVTFTYDANGKMLTASAKAES